MSEKEKDFFQDCIRVKVDVALPEILGGVQLGISQFIEVGEDIPYLNMDIDQTLEDMLLALKNSVKEALNA